MSAKILANTTALSKADARRECGDTRPIAGTKSPTVPARTQATGVSRYADCCEKEIARGANPTEAVSHLVDVTDRMHGMLMDRADALMGCLEGSAEVAELSMFTDIMPA